MRRAIFIRTDRLGETLLNLPAVAALQQALPNASVALLVNPELQPLFEGVPGLGPVLAAPPDQSPRAWWVRAWRLGRLLRAGRFDAAVVSNPRKELHLAVWLARIPIRVGYGRKWGCLLTHPLPDRKALGERHEVEYNLDLVRALGFPTTARPWTFPAFSREQAELPPALGGQGLQLSGPFIAVHPWSSHALKEWPAERYQALIRRLANELAVRIVVVGGADARTRVSAVLPDPRAAVDAVGRLSLRQLAALLQCARLLISNDSGPVHLAAALATPTVALFGGTNPGTSPRRWGPWGGGHTVIWKPSIAAIGVEEVFEAVCRQLGHDARRPA